MPDGDAIIMAQKLARTLGIGAGISAGANLLAAIEVQDRLGGDAVVVSIICDDNKKYLSTDLAKKEPVRPGYRCPHVELLTYEVSSLPRPCEDGSTIHSCVASGFVSAFLLHSLDTRQDAMSKFSVKAGC